MEQIGKPHWLLWIATGVFLFIASAFGSWAGQRIGQGTGGSAELPMILHADSASGGKSMSMATGMIDRRRVLDGLFVLDHLSGLLQCWLINPRTGSIAGIFSTNVNEHLNLSKGGEADFVMTTGNIEIEARQNNQPLAGCICYVGDGNTGKVVGYSLYYDRQTVINNGVQNGELVVIARGLAREAGLRRDE